MKNPTQWFTPVRRGNVTFTTGFSFQDNLGNMIIDNLGDNIVVTPLIVTPQPPTLWNVTILPNSIEDEINQIIYDESNDPILDESLV